MGTNPLKSLAAVEDALNGWLKPKVFGESWDNIGLLVGSGKYPNKDDKEITGIVICNDLKPAVVDEAIKLNANLVIAYHPPIFSGMKSIAYGSWKEQLIAKCLFNDISVYSPHTTLDSIAGGITDAVIAALGQFGSKDSDMKSKAIHPSNIIDPLCTGWMYTSSSENISTLLQTLKLSKYKNVVVQLDTKEDQHSATLAVYGNVKSEITATDIDEIKRIAKTTGIPEFMDPAIAHPTAFGSGRIVRFNNPVEFPDVVDAIKKGLNLDYVQVVYAGKSQVESAAVCVGSGSSVLNGVAADVYITGEMSHHPQLDCQFSGASVILCNHCDSERHYLPKLASIVKLLTNIDNIYVSKEDKSPLKLSN